MPMEQWFPIRERPSFYQVSNYGQVRSKIKKSLTIDSRAQVQLTIHGRNMRFNIHDLMRDNIPEDLRDNKSSHKDSDINSSKELYWFGHVDLDNKEELKEAIKIVKNGESCKNLTVRCELYGSYKELHTYLNSCSLSSFFRELRLDCHVTKFKYVEDEKEKYTLVYAYKKDKIQWIEYLDGFAPSFYIDLDHIEYKRYHTEISDEELLRAVRFYETGLEEDPLESVETSKSIVPDWESVMDGYCRYCSYPHCTPFDEDISIDENPFQDSVF